MGIVGWSVGDEQAERSVVVRTLDAYVAREDLDGEVGLFHGLVPFDLYGFGVVVQVVLRVHVLV